jgi:hypothetical protein
MMANSVEVTHRYVVYGLCKISLSFWQDDEIFIWTIIILALVLRQVKIHSSQIIAIIGGFPNK